MPPSFPAQDSVSLSDQLLYLDGMAPSYGGRPVKFYTLPELVDAIIEGNIDAYPVAKRDELPKGKKKQKVQYTYSAPVAATAKTTSLEFRISTNIVSDTELLRSGLVVAHMPAAMIRRFNEETQKMGLYNMSKKYGADDLFALFNPPSLETSVDLSRIKKFMGADLPVYRFEEFMKMEKGSIPQYYAVVFGMIDANSNEKVKIARFGGTQRYFSYKQLLKSALEKEKITEDMLDAKNFPAERQLYAYGLKFHQFSWPPMKPDSVLPSVMDFDNSGRSIKYLVTYQ